MQQIEAKSILNKKKKRDEWFLDDYTLNPYTACTFNCQFCYIRGSKYGLHMERRVAAKKNAPELLDIELAKRAKKKEYGFIVIGSATDPYLHFEESEQLSRRILQVILKHRFPVHVITRSPLVERDFDLLMKIQERAFLPVDLYNSMKTKAFLSFSFSGMNQTINKLFEPGAPPIQARLDTMQRAAQLGIMTGACLMPLLPYISDLSDQIDDAFQIIKLHGAKYGLAAGLTLFGTGTADSKTLTMNLIEKHFAELKWKYLELFAFGSTPQLNYQEALATRIRNAADKVNLPTQLLQADKLAQSD